MTARSVAPAPRSPNVARYQVEHKLGEGAAGAVFLARDRETGEQVALKKLFRMDAKSVLRLKREFRSLQALNHPHLVKLYDMGQAEDAWFLTMEYLDGTDFTSYLGGEADAPVVSTPDASRLLSAFRQLARGIQALHDAGLLHRDLKPSNVLVVGQRVVVLDFGLLRELDVAAATVTEDGSAAGTPAYMAPEQILGEPLTAASDWYAFGVMLYEAISGLLPFDGSMLQLIKAKLESEPVALDHETAGVPAWLCELCSALLRRDPAARPSGAELLGQLAVLPPTAAANATQTETLPYTDIDSQSGKRTLVGRTTQTQQLRTALSRAAEGASVVAHVRAPSGTGKSTLIEHFLDEVEALSAAKARDALVLRSRCYELEAMPFKALDGLMDALARHLGHLDDLDVAHLLPAEIAALAQVFPVLERVRVVKQLIGRTRATHDAIHIRMSAEKALRSLLDGLAARAPLVLCIDDLQWGDLDSARILKRWIATPSAVPILFILSYRSDEVETSSCLQQLLAGEGEVVAVPAYTIDLAPLAAAEARALCEARLREHTPQRAELIERVVREADGSPFLASQLIALAEAKRARGDTDLHTLSLDLMVAQTSALLAADAKKLLVVLAVAGRPMTPKLLAEAAGVKRGVRALVHELRGLSLVRTREVAGQRRLEVYHDQIRERVQRALSEEESRGVHRRLFDALEHSGEAEPDWLHALALGAGHLVAALHYGQIAAARASASLAFERAAGLYRSCVALAPPEEVGVVWRELATALARCGRGVAAAEACLEAAKYAPEAERVAWTERAAAHLLRSGHFAQGEALVREVLTAKAIDVPTSRAGVIAAIVWERARIKLRGAREAARSGEYPAELLERYDLLASLYLNTGVHDRLRAALFQVRALRCALEAGEPARLVHALSSASTSAALMGSEQAARESAALLARAEVIQARLSEPDAKPILTAHALNAFWLGHFQEVLEPAREADRLFRLDAQSDQSGNYFARLTVMAVRLVALQLLGQYDELAVQLRGVLDEAVAHDNRALLLQTTQVQTQFEQVVRGRDASARSRLEAQRVQLPDGAFSLLHVTHMNAVIGDACWTGDYRSVREYVAQSWASFLHSQVGRVPVLGMSAYSEHARFVLNLHVAEGRPADSFRAVNADIQALDKLAVPWASVAARISRARLARLTGDTREAIDQLRACVVSCRALCMPHTRARAEYALGVLLGGAEGTALCAAAKQCIHDLGVVDVDADLHAYYPEFMGDG